MVPSPTRNSQINFSFLNVQDLIPSMCMTIRYRSIALASL